MSSNCPIVTSSAWPRIILTRTWGSLEAYALLRERWPLGDPPALVMAGHSLRSRMRMHDQIESKPMENGVTFLGSVTADELRSFIRMRSRSFIPHSTKASGCRRLRRWPRALPSSRCRFRRSRELAVMPFYAADFGRTTWRRQWNASPIGKPSAQTGAGLRECRAVSLGDDGTIDVRGVRRGRSQAVGTIAPDARNVCAGDPELVRDGLGLIVASRRRR